MTEKLRGREGILGINFINSYLKKVVEIGDEECNTRGAIGNSQVKNKDVLLFSQGFV